eukprot:c13645_g1_i1 orf=409-618(-)
MNCEVVWQLEFENCIINMANRELIFQAPPSEKQQVMELKAQWCAAEENRDSPNEKRITRYRKPPQILSR